MPPDDRPPDAQGYGQGYAYFGMALSFTVAILLFGGLGWVVDGWLHTRPLIDRRRLRRRVRGVHEHLLPREARYREEAAKAQALLVVLGAALIAIVGLLGGRAAAIGGGTALVAQVWAVALLRPKMGAPTPEFMGRWLGGMAIRFLALSALLVWAATHRASLPPLPAALGFLGVLLPLLFLETRFLR